MRTTHSSLSLTTTGQCARVCAIFIRSVGLNVQTFASAHEFLTSQRPDAPSCLVLDVQLPGLSGLDLQQELAKVNAQIPIIFITGHGDIPMTVRAMKAGAIEFLDETVPRPGPAQRRRAGAAPRPPDGAMHAHAGRRDTGR